MTQLIYQSSKTYTHSQGLSCCFRQWRATHSHCSKLHGYAIQVKVVFESDELDARNWVMDFGGLKDLKAYLQSNFDHTTLVAEDDPELTFFRSAKAAGIIDLVVVEAVGCEKFAEMIYWHIVNEIRTPPHVRVKSVEVSEHEGNSAIVIRKD